MRHGVISLLADDDVPDITVGIGWNEGTDERYRARLPETALIVLPLPVTEITLPAATLIVLFEAVMLSALAALIILPLPEMMSLVKAARLIVLPETNNVPPEPSLMTAPVPLIVSYW